MNPIYKKRNKLTENVGTDSFCMIMHNLSLFLIVTRTLNWEKHQNENNCYNCSSAQSSAFNGCANNYTQPQPG